jgi:hypothetical protein
MSTIFWKHFFCSAAPPELLLLLPFIFLWLPYLNARSLFFPK